MPDDFKKLEEEILSLPPGEKSRLLHKLIEALRSESGGDAGQPSVIEEAAALYEAEKPVGGKEEEVVQAILSASRGPFTERGGIMDQLDRITQQPGMMGGKACIRGMRVTVGMIIGQIAAGASIEDLLSDYPYLEREDIRQALRYAAWRAEEREVNLIST